MLPAPVDVDTRVAEQLIALREGKLPDELDPSLRLESCDVLIAQGRIAEAARIAEEVLDESAD